MHVPSWLIGVATLVALGPGFARAQASRPPKPGEPGDAMIQRYLSTRAKALDDRFLEGVTTAEDWGRMRPRLHGELLDMLGLDPLPARSPLKATVTKTFEGDGYVVENLHYQSVPGLYVTGNLYRPSKVEPGTKLPTIFYVCGHSPMGRDGNKVAYQSHGIWYARHGYVCLVVDTLQLGEIPGIHHGTYREGRWWWLSRGYSPAGVECWNGMRGIDYLISRPDVDPDRIGVTGISGGGVVTFWIAAADDRVKAAIPISGMSDLEAYVGDQIVNEHCDCMFFYNVHHWPWTQAPALIAPRPLLFVNSDQDVMFPMDANERVIGRLERFYSLFGAGDVVDAFVSIGGHAYRRDIRRAAYRFMNIHLKREAGPVDDSEVDLVEGPRGKETFPIAPQKLRVFPTDRDIPADARNGAIDQTFVPIAKVELPESGRSEEWRKGLLDHLRRRVFVDWPTAIPPARSISESGDVVQLETEPGVVVPLHRAARPSGGTGPERILLVISGREGESRESSLAALPDGVAASDQAVFLEPRGWGASRWSRTNPPNYVNRAHMILGETPDSGRILDIIATARWLKATEKRPVALVGSGPSGVLTAFAAALEPEVAAVFASAPPASLMDREAPILLNALRVLDVPEAFGLIAPRPLSLKGAPESLRSRIRAIYQSSEAPGQLTVR